MESLDQLISKVVPENVYDENAMDYNGVKLDDPVSENQFLKDF